MFIFNHAAYAAICGALLLSLLIFDTGPEGPEFEGQQAAGRQGIQKNLH